MTKIEMLNFIEKTEMVLDFDRKYLMRRSKDYIIHLYEKAIQFAEKN